MTIRNYTRNTIAATLAAAFALASAGASAMGPGDHDTLPAGERQKALTEKRDQPARPDAQAGGYRLVDVGGRVGQIQLRIDDR